MLSALQLFWLLWIKIEGVLSIVELVVPQLFLSILRQNGENIIHLHNLNLISDVGDNFKNSEVAFSDS